VSEVSGSSGSRLRELLEVLSRAKEDLAGTAVPPAETVEKLAVNLRELGNELSRWSKKGSDEGSGEAEKLEDLRLAAKARRELKAVAELARGSARFASLLKGIEKDDREGGIYGRDGKATGGPGSAKIERQV
jgi:hypothetical protein